MAIPKGYHFLPGFDKTSKPFRKELQIHVADVVAMKCSELIVYFQLIRLKVMVEELLILEFSPSPFKISFSLSTTRHTLRSASKSSSLF